MIFSELSVQGGIKMAKVGRPSSGKVKLVSVRLTPKMKYSIELLARVQRRGSTTEVIEFALEKLLHDKDAGLINAKGEYLPDLIFDQDEIKCFVKIPFCFLDEK